MCFTDLQQKNSRQITVYEVARILDCVVIDIEYKDAYGGGYTWKMPNYILFEKNGYQLELKAKSSTSIDEKTGFELCNYEKIKCRIIHIKHNKKCKHTSKLDIGGPKLISVSN